MEKLEKTEDVAYARQYLCLEVDIRWEGHVGTLAYTRSTYAYDA